MTRTIEELRLNAKSVKTGGLTDQHGRPLRLVVQWFGEMTVTEWVLTSGGRYAPTGLIRRVEA